MAEEHPPDWPKIVVRHAERVFRIANHILGSVHDAEDVSQLVFIEAKNVQEAGPIQSWSGLFARLATTRAIDLLHRRRKSIEIVETQYVSNLEPHHHFVGAELAAWLRSHHNRKSRTFDSNNKKHSLAVLDSIDFDRDDVVWNSNGGFCNVRSQCSETKLC